MTDKKGLGIDESVEEPDGDDRWTFSQDPGVRALLDHVAEELAIEFVRLMRSSVVAETEANPKEKKR